MTYVSSIADLITHRIVARAGVTGVITMAGGKDLKAFTWQEDLLMSSFYHSTWQGTAKWNDGSRWCSDFKVVLPVAGTAVEAMATFGFNGRTKCTW